ncbi:MAG: isochorismate synthase [Verrucomicrobia bacterium]|nr:isochorismate synthase [Verrucomicrobiota bacterium]
MSNLEIDNLPYAVEQLTIELPSLDLIDWLSYQEVYPKVFWKDREGGVTRGALGNLLSFTHVPTLFSPTDLDIRLYGGMRFSKKRKEDATWDGFPHTSFWLPQFEIVQEGKRTYLTANFLNEYANPEALQGLHFEKHDQDPSPTYALRERTDAPEKAIWEAQVDKVLEEIAGHRLEKLVLARKTELRFAEPLSPWTLLKALKERSQNALLFAFELSRGSAFLGATPEKLFSREGNRFRTEAIAGTRPRGRTPDEDAELEQELLSSEKLRREFSYVKQFLQHALLSCADKVAWDGEEKTLKLPHVQHLYHKLTGTLKKGITDATLVQMLHPTPALGSFPQHLALSAIDELETFERGWYGSPIGIISPKGADFAVAIRSARLREDLLSLFAGAGIVAGSLPEKEWEELEQKIRLFTQVVSSQEALV